jgi:hypothetical protein
MGHHGVGRHRAWVLGLMTVVSSVVGCGDEPRLGRASVSAAVVDETRCPTIYAMVAQPGQVVVGGQIDVKAIATADRASDVLTYAWSSAVAGTAGLDGANAVHNCLTAGDPLVTVKVTETAGPGVCSVEESLPVHCLMGPPP